MATPTCLHSTKRCVVERNNGTVTKKYFKRALKPQSLRRSNPLNTIHHEVQMMQRVQHPGIVEFLRLREDEHVIEIDMVDGGDALTTARCPIEDIRSWITTISNALMNLHAQSIVHLDIKPSNILIKDNHARICDFGSSLECTPTGQLPKYPNLTPAFSSPEFCLMSMNAASVVGMVQGRPQDMWALGVTLYSLLFGKMPFKCEDDVITCYMSIVDDVPDMKGKVLLNGKESDLPDGMSTILQGLLDKSPTKRLTAEKLYKKLIKL